MAHISPSGSRTARLWKRIDQAADTDRPQPLMQLAIGGSLVRLQAAKVPRPIPASTTRGAITGFSAAARKRLIGMLASINRQQLERLPLFVTLTYPAAWPVDPATWKRQLDTWLKRLERKYERTAAIWKLEFQARGAPHFHLLVFGPGWINAHWLSRSWYQVVGSGDERHLLAGTKVERIRSWKGVMYYASKYLAKQTEEAALVGVGRFWGILNREYLPFELITLPLSFGQFFLMRRLLLRWMSGTKSAIAKTAVRPRKPWRPRIRGDNFGYSLFTEVSQVLPLLRALA